MGWAEDLEEAVLPRAVAGDRLPRVMAYLCLAAALSGLVAAIGAWNFGYPGHAFKIFLGAASILLTLPLLRMVQDWQIAGHYLAANIFLQSILLAPSPTISCIILVSLAAGVALFRTGAARFWIAAIVARCGFVAITSATELESATAAAITFAAAVTFLIVQITESSRLRSLRLEKVATQQTAGQVAILNKLVNSYFDAFMLVSGNDIHSVGPGIESFLGYTQQDFPGRPLAYYLHPDEVQLIENLQPGAPPSRHEVRIRHSDGRWVWIEAYSVPDVVHHRQDRRLVVFRNFESQRKVSDQLTQAQRLESMGSIAAAVAHDFNNMLTVIMGIADQLPQGTNKSEIVRVAGSAALLTNKLLAFGHGQPVSTDVQDLSHVMQEHSLLIRHMLNSKFVLFEDYIEKPALVRIDEAQFEQVVVNLINNAREAMPDGGDLEISLSLAELDRHTARHDAEGPYAVLEVKDSGRGMSAEIQTKAFDPFFSTKQHSSNSGLGLSSCYGIVAQSGGFIDIQSHPGTGTSIKVYLPLAEVHDNEPVLELITNTTSIMVVDDDPAVVRVIKSALVRAGYQVLGFTRPEAAIEAFSTSKITLVISDVVMSGMNGSDLVKRFRSQVPDLPVLFVSGAVSDELSDWEFDDITAYLAKPFRGEEIVARVEGLIGTDKPLTQAFR